MNSSTPRPEDKGPKIVKFNIAMIVIPIVAVAVRFWSRGTTQQGRYGSDDWLCLLAMVFSLVYSALSIQHSQHGLGKHEDPEKPRLLRYGFILFYAGFIVFGLGVSTIKFSVLGFYDKIFARNKTFKHALWSTYGLVLAKTLFIVPATIFACQPMHKYWDIQIPGHCLNSQALYISNTVFDVVLDLTILLLPMPFLWKLQMSTSRKILVTGAFACGYCALVTFLGQLVESIKVGHGFVNDPFYNMVDLVLWSQAEMPSTILSVCLPSWFSLVKRASTYWMRSLFTAKDLAVAPQLERRSKLSERGFLRLRGPNIDAAGLAMPAVSVGESPTGSPPSYEDVAMDRMFGRKDIPMCPEDHA